MPAHSTAKNEIMDSVALLVIDAQDIFINAIHDRENFLTRTAFIIEAARTLRIKTIFTEQAPQRLGRTNSRLLSLARHPKVFAKKAFSALKADGIQQYLKNQEVYNLIVCGLETPICVYQTALNAEEIDVDCTLLTDALSCRRKADEGPALDAIRKLNCELLPSETVFYSLLSDIDHPQFKAFNNLVKSYHNREFDDEYFKAQIVDRGPRTDSREVEPQAPARDNQSESENGEAEGKTPNPRKNRNRRRRGNSNERRQQSDFHNAKAEQEANSEEKKREETPKENPSPWGNAARQNEKSETPANEQASPTLTPETPQPEVKKDEALPVETNETPKPKKRVAKKTAKKAAKKATKRVAKKAVKKKVAANTDADTSSKAETSTPKEKA